jgi:hypothetical protein
VVIRAIFVRAPHGAVDLVFSVFWAVTVALCAAGILYAGTIAWGTINGDALPTATAFHDWPQLGLIWDMALFSSHAMFTAAGLGSIIAWFASATPAWDRYRRHEKLLGAFWSRAAWPLVPLLALFLLSGGGWAGRYSPYEMHYMSLAGLIPYSDASVYYGVAFDNVYQGSWNAIASQRPLAASFRTVFVWLGAYSYATTLVLQTIAVALAIALCARSVAKSYGPWVALGFTGLALGLGRPFFSTMMTESLGLIWALISLTLFLHSFRFQYMPTRMLGYAALCLGLLTRTGSMFTIPIIAAWMGLAMPGDLTKRTRILAVTVAIVVAVWALERLIGFAFSSTSDTPGANFAYTACGLARGTNWHECSVTFANELANRASDRKAQNAFLWRVALDTALARPSVLFGSLLETMRAYVENIPRFFIVQYTTLFWPSHAFVQVVVLMLLPGWLYFAHKRERLLETTFYLALLVSVVLSAAFVFRDDGGRVLTVTHVFVAMLLALGLSNPMMPRAVHTVITASWRPMAAGLATLILLLIAAPIGTRLLSGSSERRIAAEHRSGNIALALPGPALTGFLVLPDDAPLRRDVPSIHHSALEAILRQTNIERDLGQFASEITTRLPAALVYAPRVDSPNFYNLYIVPEEVITARDVTVWQLEPEGGRNVPVVSRATPLR